MAKATQQKEPVEYGMSRASLSGKTTDEIREGFLVIGGLLTGVGVMLGGALGAAVTASKAAVALGGGSKVEAAAFFISAALAIGPSIWGGLKATSYIGNKAFDPVGSLKWDAAIAAGERSGWLSPRRAPTASTNG